MILYIISILVHGFERSRDRDSIEMKLRLGASGGCGWERLTAKRDKGHWEGDSDGPKHDAGYIT